MHHVFRLIINVYLSNVSTDIILADMQVSISTPKYIMYNHMDVKRFNNYTANWTQQDRHNITSCMRLTLSMSPTRFPSDFALYFTWVDSDIPWNRVTELIVPEWRYC